MEAPFHINGSDRSRILKGTCLT
uniref:Uncharacterized protein n=1 Tax=Anguilla anguilla TaxID=7936 RepID=A0A0E9XUB3_ANGAN